MKKYLFLLTFFYLSFKYTLVIANSIFASDSIRLVSCYPFNGNANDSKGVSNGIVNGAALTADRFGNPNSAYLLDGNDYINIPLTADNNYFGANQNYTISLWFTTQNVSLNQPIYAIQPINSTLSIFTQLYYNAYYNQQVTVSSPVISPNQWYHAVIVREGVNFKIFINGSVTALGALLNDYLDTRFLYLGGRPGDNNSLNGKIDDFQIYKGALTTQQIEYIYNAQTGCDDPTVTPTLIFNPLPTLNYCKNQTFSIAFSSINILPTAEDPIMVELSDIDGNFVNPVILGTTTNVSGNIIAQFPANQEPGTNYKLRLKQNNKISTEQTIAINIPFTANISGDAVINEGETANLLLNFTGTPPWTYSINNGENQTANATPVTITVMPQSTTTYAITSFSTTACDTGIVSGSATVTVNPIADYLVSCYPFSGNANDSKGVSNGIVNGAALTTDRFGNPNSAYYFDGNDYINIPLTENNITFFTQNHTLSFWVNTESIHNFGNMMYIIGNYEPIYGGYYALHMMQLYSDLKLRYFSLYNGSIIVNNPVLTLNQWYHVAMVRDGKNYKIFINGSLAAEGSFESNTQYPPDIFYLGMPEGNHSRFIGKIDDFQIYNGILTSSRITALYNATSTQACYNATLPPCITQQTFTSTLNGNQHIKGVGQIIALNTIKSNASIHFDAKNSVELRPGFQTERNTVFKASIGGACN